MRHVFRAIFWTLLLACPGFVSVSIGQVLISEGPLNEVIVQVSTPLVQDETRNAPARTSFFEHFAEDTYQIHLQRFTASDRRAAERQADPLGATSNGRAGGSTRSGKSNRGYPLQGKGHSGSGPGQAFVVISFLLISIVGVLVWLSERRSFLSGRGQIGDYRNARDRDSPY